MSHTSRFSAVGRALGAALVFTLVFSAGAESEPYSQDTLDLYRLSGLASQIASTEFQIVESISIQTQSLPEDVRRTLIESIGEQFDSGAVRAAALAEMEEGRDPERAKGALEWLRSPVGLRIVALEAAAFTPNGMSELQAYARVLVDDPPLQERVDFAERLDAVSGATNRAIDAAVGSNLVIAVAINAARPEPDQIKIEDLRDIIDARRWQFRPILEQLTLVSYLYMMRELPDGDLERYIAFFETDSGAWYRALTSKAVFESLLTLSARTGEVLGEALKTEGAKQPL
jgi:hypothetical protein